jgi:SAM-dependent methyltransferase
MILNKTKIFRKARNYRLLLLRCIKQTIDPYKLVLGIYRYTGYIRDLIKYSKMNGAEPIRIIDIYPRIHEKTQTTAFDIHYFYQDIWAFQRVQKSGTDIHIDVGSKADFVGFLTSVTKVIFVDIRPLEASLENFESMKGSILSLPFKDGSVQSLSCLSVAEHVGLGRYSDPLDPHGTEKAAKELYRVLAENGNLYFALPVGKPRLCFNAHRIHSPQQIIDYFCNLDLVELSGIDDKGIFLRNIDINILADSDYACGLFWFKKPERHSF